MSASTNRLREVENPYESPRGLGGATPPQLPVEIWSQGDQVIAHREASWPRICIQTGMPAENPTPIHTPQSPWPVAVFFLIFMIVPFPFILFVYFRPRAYPLGWTITFMSIILAFVGVAYLLLVSRQRKITVYLSDAPANRRRIAKIVAWILSLALLLAFATYFFLPSSVRLAAIMVGSLISIGMSIVARRWLHLLRPIKLQKEFVVFRGAGKAFLCQLPPWPYGPT